MGKRKTLKVHFRHMSSLLNNPNDCFFDNRNTKYFTSTQAEIEEAGFSIKVERDNDRCTIDGEKGNSFIWKITKK